MQRPSTPTHRPHPPIGLVAAAVLATSVFGGALTYLFWREWLAFAASYPIVADVLRFMLFAAPVALAVGYGVTGLTIWYRRWGWRESVFADKQIALKKAEVQIAPLATSFSYHDSRQGFEAGLEDEDAAQPPQLPQLSGGSGGTLAQFHQAGHVCRSGNSLLVGYSDGVPQYIELPECGFIGIGGQPRVGKSTTSLLIIEQAILSGWHVFIGDPHIRKADGLLSRCRPLSGRLAKQAVTPDEIAIMVRTVDKIGRRRVQGDTDRTPVLLIVDEFSNLVWRDLLPADVLAVLPSMAAEYAGVGVHGVLIAHDWSKASLGGDLGAALRRAITHRLIHRMDPGNTEFLLPKGSSAQARAVQGLEKGRALFYGPDGGVMVTVPWLTDTDAAYAAQGTPPRPYAPRQIAAAVAPAAPSVPPTLRVPQQPVRQVAPPTVPMIITVPEQILDLLRARTSWMTASEIAAALRIDEHVIRTEIKVLVNTGQISRRPCAARTTKERYEYSQSTSQRVNVSTALSA
jgi:hypothetical protein